jgi:hypothetical protein
MKKKALLLMLFFMFISTNALSQSVIWGYVTGDKISGVKVNVYKLNCGANERIGVLSTNAQGQYGIGGLEDGTYTVEPKSSGHDFSPNLRSVEIIPEVSEYGNVNFVSEVSCEIKCDQLYDYCMDNASAWWMNCTFSGWSNCAAEDWVNTETCRAEKELCKDKCEW